MATHRHAGARRRPVLGGAAAAPHGPARAGKPAGPHVKAAGPRLGPVAARGAQSAEAAGRRAVPGGHHVKPAGPQLARGLWRPAHLGHRLAHRADAGPQVGAPSGRLARPAARAAWALIKAAARLQAGAQRGRRRADGHRDAARARRRAAPGGRRRRCAAALRRQPAQCISLAQRCRLLLTTGSWKALAAARLTIDPTAGSWTDRQAGLSSRLQLVGICKAAALCQTASSLPLSKALPCGKRAPSVHDGLSARHASIAAAALALSARRSAGTPLCRCRNAPVPPAAGPGPPELHCSGPSGVAAGPAAAALARAHLLRRLCLCGGLLLAASAAAGAAGPALVLSRTRLGRCGGHALPPAAVARSRARVAAGRLGAAPAGGPRRHLAAALLGRGSGLARAGARAAAAGVPALLEIMLWLMQRRMRLRASSCDTSRLSAQKGQTAAASVA